MSEWLFAWLSAFFFTQAVEVPIYVWAMGLEPPGGRPSVGRSSSAEILERRALAYRLALAFAASLITHPVVWFVIPRLVYQDYIAMVAVAETFAVVVEALWLRAFRVRQPFAWALLANGASAGLGFASRYLFGWP